VDQLTALALSVAVEAPLAGALAFGWAAAEARRGGEGAGGTEDAAGLGTGGAKPVASAAARGAGRGRRVAAVALTAAGATLLTHPFLWHGCLWCMTKLPYGLCVTLGESLVVLAEAAAYAGVARLPMRWALGVSLGANAASCGLGLLLQGVA
jgi:hypothetical protein